MTKKQTLDLFLKTWSFVPHTFRLVLIIARAYETRTKPIQCALHSWYFSMATRAKWVCFVSGQLFCNLLFFQLHPRGWKLKRQSLLYCIYYYKIWFDLIYFTWRKAWALYKVIMFVCLFWIKEAHLTVERRDKNGAVGLWPKTTRGNVLRWFKLFNLVRSSFVFLHPRSLCVCLPLIALMYTLW